MTLSSEELCSVDTYSTMPSTSTVHCIISRYIVPWGRHNKLPFADMSGRLLFANNGAVVGVLFYNTSKPKELAKNGTAMSAKDGSEVFNAFPYYHTTYLNNFLNSFEYYKLTC